MLDDQILSGTFHRKLVCCEVAPGSRLAQVLSPWSREMVSFQGFSRRYLLIGSVFAYLFKAKERISLQERIDVLMDPIKSRSGIRCVAT